MTTGKCLCRKLKVEQQKTRWEGGNRCNKTKNTSKSFNIKLSAPSKSEGTNEGSDAYDFNGNREKRKDHVPGIPTTDPSKSESFTL